MAFGFDGRTRAQSDQSQHDPGWGIVVLRSCATSNDRHAANTNNHERRHLGCLRACATATSGLAGLCDQYAVVCAGGNDRRLPVVAGSPSGSLDARSVSFVWVRPTPRLFDRLSGMWMEAPTTSDRVIDGAAATLWISCRNVGSLYEMRPRIACEAELTNPTSTFPRFCYAT